MDEKEKIYEKINQNNKEKEQINMKIRELSLKWRRINGKINDLRGKWTIEWEKFNLCAHKNATDTPLSLRHTFQAKLLRIPAETYAVSYSFWQNLVRGYWPRLALSSNNSVFQPKKSPWQFILCIHLASEPGQSDHFYSFHLKKEPRQQVSLLPKIHAFRLTGPTGHGAMPLGIRPREFKRHTKFRK